MIGDVLSRVDPDKAVFRDVCYEWEEEISEFLNVPVRQITAETWHRGNVVVALRSFVGKMFPALTRAMKLLRERFKPVLSQDINLPLSLCFVMLVPEYTVCRGVNCLPVFLDVWRELHGGISFIAEKTRKLKIFYVTSRDVYNAIREMQPESGVRYIPLSVSDNYYSCDFVAYRNKTVDVVQFGRANYVLHEYMLRYVREHEETEYIYSGTGRSAGSYMSTKRGEIGKILGRSEFMKMLSSAKVSLVSSPGFENSKDYAHGIHFVTPRFYESAILGCSLIGRYPDNEEFRELNMSRYCPNITSYDQFVRELERALAITPEELYAQNRDFILNSLTSKRAERIQKDLEELTCQNS